MYLRSSKPLAGHTVDCSHCSSNYSHGLKLLCMPIADVTSFHRVQPDCCPVKSCAWHCLASAVKEMRLILSYLFHKFEFALAPPYDALADTTIKDRSPHVAAWIVNPMSTQCPAFPRLRTPTQRISAASTLGAPWAPWTSSMEAGMFSLTRGDHEQPRQTGAVSDNERYLAACSEILGDKLGAQSPHSHVVLTCRWQ